MSKYYEDSDGKRYEKKEHLFGGEYYGDSDGKTYEKKEHLFGGEYYEDSDGKTYETKEHLFGGEYIEDSDGKTYEKKEHLFGGTYYEDSDGKTYEEKESLCFISTACVQAMGLPDDAAELVTLRQFRQNQLSGTSEGEAILAEYRKISKEILSWIQQQPNKQDLYQEIFDRLVVKSVELINEGQFEMATNHYRKVVSEYGMAARTLNKNEA